MAHDWNQTLAALVAEFACDSGTLHVLQSDGLLHLTAHTPNIPSPVLAAVRTVPVGKGMAGLCVERRAPVDACNLQTDTSGDVRPGARATGSQGAIVVPLMKDGVALGALGVANFRERVFTSDEVAALTQRAAEWATEFPA
jgi:L-methionine (R)-S-oxide reductase